MTCSIRSRIAGNQAAHDHSGDHKEALTALKVARQLGIWFHRIFGRDRTFSPGPFIPPPDPEAAAVQLHAELERLRQALAESQGTAERARLEVEEYARARENAEERALQEAREREIWEQLAQEADAAKASLATELASLQKTAQQAPVQQKTTLIEQGQEAARAIDLDETATRTIIDRQLQERGWEADSEKSRYAGGAALVQSNYSITHIPHTHVSFLGFS